MMQALVVCIALSVGMGFGMFVAGARRRIEGIDGHVRIGNVWHEIDGHGRVVIKPENTNA